MPTLITLNKRADFKIVQTKGEKWITKAFVVLAAPSSHPEPTAIRFGLIASGKLGGAVIRNRARRRLREVIRAILPEQGQTDIMYVIIARSEALTLPFENLQKDFLWALNKIHQRLKDKDNAVSE